MIELRCDVVCIGAGGAGVTAAVTAASQGARTMLLSKEPIGYGNTRLALGVKAHTGLTPGDSADSFLADLMAGGEWIADPSLARVIADESPRGTVVAEGFGHIFRRGADGRVGGQHATRPGGHTIGRALASNGYGGVALGQAVRAGAARAGIEILEEVAVTRLLVRQGRIRGLLAVRLRDGESLAIAANSVVLATGGAGWLYYPHTDCLRTATGDGYTLALEAGADLVDMEQVQFMPFATTHPASMVGLFVGEPRLADAHGRLLDAAGRVVLTGISSMTRAEVAVAISRELAAGNGTPRGGLLLDLAPNFAGVDGPARWQKASKSAAFQLIRRAYGAKAYRCEEPWDVCPSAHFNMGGIAIDPWGRSSVPGLLAAGEAAGGVHGGNRLGSVALAEIFVFGRRAGLAAAEWAGKSTSTPAEAPWRDERPASTPRSRGGTAPRPIELIRRLQGVMWRHVGLVRSEDDCAQALHEIEEIRATAEPLPIEDGSGYNPQRLDALELPVMLGVARVIVLSAQARRESRGAHCRSDYPDRSTELGRSNVYTTLRDGRLEASLRPVGSWPPGSAWPEP